MRSPPSAPAAVGIDIGKFSYHICLAGQGKPRSWPVQQIDTKYPTWWQSLAAIIPPGSTICVEPTGYHYFAPIWTALNLRERPEVWQVNNHVTRYVRNVDVSRSKTDDMDARALAVIAQRIQRGEELIGVRQHLHGHVLAAHELRLIVNQRRRLVKDQTKAKNVLNQLAFSIWPQLSHRMPAYLIALAHGAATPDEIKNLLSEEAKGIRHAQRRKAVERLVAETPYFTSVPSIADSIRQTYQHMQQVAEQISDLNQQLEQRIQAPPFNEASARWQTVPGFNGDQGPAMIAALHVAAQGQIHHITRDEFKAACGCAPQRQSSGKIDQTRATKGGYRPAKDAIHLISQYLQSPKSPPNPIRVYVARMPKGNKAGPARRKLAGILWGVAQDPNGWKYMTTNRKSERNQD